MRESPLIPPDSYISLAPYLLSPFLHYGYVLWFQKSPSLVRGDSGAADAGRHSALLSNNQRLRVPPDAAGLFGRNRTPSPNPGCSLLPPTTAAPALRPTPGTHPTSSRHLSSLHGMSALKQRSHYHPTASISKTHHLSDFYMHAHAQKLYTMLSLIPIPLNL
jgi:hypothetical protein